MFSKTDFHFLFSEYGKLTLNSQRPPVSVSNFRPRQRRSYVLFLELCKKWKNRIRYWGGFGESLRDTYQKFQKIKIIFKFCSKMIMYRSHKCSQGPAVTRVKFFFLFFRTSDLFIFGTWFASELYFIFFTQCLSIRSMSGSIKASLPINYQNDFIPEFLINVFLQKVNWL